MFLMATEPGRTLPKLSRGFPSLSIRSASSAGPDTRSLPPPPSASDSQRRQAGVPRPGPCGRCPPRAGDVPVLETWIVRHTRSCRRAAGASTATGGGADGLEHAGEQFAGLHPVVPVTPGAGSLPRGGPRKFLSGFSTRCRVMRRRSRCLRARWRRVIAGLPGPAHKSRPVSSRPGSCPRATPPRGHLMATHSPALGPGAETPGEIPSPRARGASAPVSSRMSTRVGDDRKRVSLHNCGLRKAAWFSRRRTRKAPWPQGQSLSSAMCMGGSFLPDHRMCGGTR